MKKKYKFIFDMDGTLYQFDKGKSKTFVESRFYVDLRENICKFIMDKNKISKSTAIAEFKRINKKYNGEISLGMRIEHKIEKNEYFGNTWNLNPKKYIKKDKELVKIFDLLEDKAILLTNAPRIWADIVLDHLEIKEFFGNRMYTGEPILRKPNPLIFQKISEDLGFATSEFISIGDQEESDILPAQSIGMKTIHIGQGSTSANYQAKDIVAAINILRKEGYI